MKGKIKTKQQQQQQRKGQRAGSMGKMDKATEDENKTVKMQGQENMR